jgi:hypothetical protein
MVSEDFDALLTRMGTIAEAVNAFTSEDVQRKAFSALVAAFHGKNHSAKRQHTAEVEPEQDPTKAKRSRKAKTMISMDKNLDLAPHGKTSAVQFANEKSPSNVKQKGVVAVYYLREFIRLPKVSAPAVFAFFKCVQWPVPANLKNVLHQAGTDGWLDTANGEEIRLTSMGENLVVHELPAKAKARGKAKTKP